MSFEQLEINFELMASVALLVKKEYVMSQMNIYQAKELNRKGKMLRSVKFPHVNLYWLTTKKQ